MTGLELADRHGAADKDNLVLDHRIEDTTAPETPLLKENASVEEECQDQNNPNEEEITGVDFDNNDGD